MRFFKSFVSIFLSLNIILSLICVCERADAETVSDSISATYSGNYDSNVPFVFDIYSVNYNENTFTGHVKIDDSDMIISIDTNISGKITLYSSYYICNFSFKYKWLFTSYDAVFTITVFPYEGRAVGDGGGGMLIYSQDFPLNGTVDNSYNKFLSYSEKDMELCMFFSKQMYGTEDTGNVKNALLINSPIFDLSKFNKNDVYAKNTSDTSPDNVSFAILNRANGNSIDIFVVIRGTLWDEWQGNTQITGDKYDSSVTTHDNFNKAKDSLKNDISDYYKKYQGKYEKINLIITGHSRGAAVSNLYAKEATDVANGSELSNIPKFDTVTAYTFACPNVAKYNESMKSYTNIYNYWFNTDIVPTVPLTSPIDGWNYWKYGSCYTMDITSLEKWSFDIEKKYFSLYVFGNLNANIKNELSNAFSQWSTVEDYYNKKFLMLSSSIVPSLDYVSLYDFLYTATYFMTNSVSTKLFGVKAINDAVKMPQLKPLLYFAISNLGTIKESHHYDTYDKFINGDGVTEGYGDKLFIYYSYNDAINEVQTLSAEIKTYSENTEGEIKEYNSNEISKLKAIANYENNNDELNWDLDNPSTWDGVTWSSDGHVKNIDFSYKWLTGTADFSGFCSLETLNLYADLFDEIDISGCSILSSFNCSYNDLNSGSIDLSNCPKLKEFYCDGCNLNTIDVSSLTDLEKLSCSFNDLISLNLENNEKLKYINCIYNYLDVHNGSVLYTQLSDYNKNNGAYTNYYQQKLPANAVVDKDEIQLLKDFAEDNNDILNWLDDNGEISLEKLQNNAMLAFDGEKYRVVSIDISGIDVRGILVLSQFDKLKVLKCTDTKITGLNLAGCNELQELYCSNSELESLVFPRIVETENSALYALECENNHLDINIFSDDIIKYIECKSGYILKYRHQVINKDISKFNERDYLALCDFATQRENQSVLNWDLDLPGSWGEVNWIYDSASKEYKLLDCRFAGCDVDGNIDLSLCENLDVIEFSGSHIRTVALPANNDVSAYEFYDCPYLEAVIINGGTTINEGAFLKCPTLQAVYVSDSVKNIHDNAFDKSTNLTIAGNKNSYAELFANKNNIPFKAGAFLCGNIVTREKKSDKNDHNYPISEVKIKSEDLVNAVTDENGYFVVFSLDDGYFQFVADYEYGYKRTLTVSIKNAPIIVPTSISMVNGDWVKDGYINGKDFSKFLHAQQGADTSIDLKYYDINKDGIVNDDDVNIVMELLSYTQTKENNNPFNVN